MVIRPIQYTKNQQQAKIRNSVSKKYNLSVTILNALKEWVTI